MEKQWFVYTESGECVRAATVWDAIRELRRFYTAELNTGNVLTEEEYNRRKAEMTW